jgi:hypothetical protein
MDLVRQVKAEALFRKVYELMKEEVKSAGVDTPSLRQLREEAYQQAGSQLTLDKMRAYVISKLQKSKETHVASVAKETHVATVQAKDTDKAKITFMLQLSVLADGYYQNNIPLPFPIVRLARELGRIVNPTINPEGPSMLVDMVARNNQIAAQQQQLLQQQRKREEEIQQQQQQQSSKRRKYIASNKAASTMSAPSPPWKYQVHIKYDLYKIII